MREERIGIGGHELVVLRPDDPESLIDERRFDENEFLPYWAELWPSGLALARHVAELDLEGRRVLEVGCGLALPSLAARSRAPTCSQPTGLPRRSSSPPPMRRRTGSARDGRAGVGRLGCARLGPFELVLAADVLYEERNAAPLLRLLDAVVARDGEALVADPGRRHAAASSRPPSGRVDDGAQRGRRAPAGGIRGSAPAGGGG